MVQTFDYELRLPSHSSRQDNSEVIPVSRFLLGQRSLFFRAAFTFSSNISAAFLVINISGLDFRIFKSFINCLHTGDLEFKIAELIHWYALAEYYECTALKERLFDIYQDHLLQKNHCRTLVRAALEGNYLELLTIELLVNCFNYWCFDEDLINLSGSERLEEILFTLKKKNRKPSLIKPVRWAIYSITEKIIKEKYADAIIYPKEAIDSFFLSALPDIFSVDQFVEEENMYSLEEELKMKDIGNSVKLVELWKIMPWFQFSKSELVQILDSNEKVPRDIIEPFIAKSNDSPEESENKDSPDDDSEETLTEKFKFNCWYEDTYTDMEIKFVYKASDNLQEKIKVYPAHNCIISSFPKLWNCNWEGNSLILPIELPYMYPRNENLLYLFLRLVYGELRIVEQERNDHKTLQNLLILTHHFQVTKAQECISELLIQNPSFVWEWFVRLRANFDYFNELFPKFGPSFTESSLTAQKGVLRPMNCPNLRSAWIKLIQTASVTEAQRAQLQEFLV